MSDSDGVEAGGEGAEEEGWAEDEGSASGRGRCNNLNLFSVLRDKMAQNVRK